MSALMLSILGDDVEAQPCCVLLSPFFGGLCVRLVDVTIACIVPTLSVAIDAVADPCSQLRSHRGVCNASDPYWAHMNYMLAFSYDGACGGGSVLTRIAGM